MKNQMTQSIIILDTNGEFCKKIRHNNEKKGN